MLQLTLSQLLSPMLDSPMLDSEQGLQLTLVVLFVSTMLLQSDSPPKLLLLAKLVRLLVFPLVVVLVLALLTFADRI